jgi:hypothetical protein
MVLNVMGMNFSLQRSLLPVQKDSRGPGAVHGKGFGENARGSI